MIKIRPARPDSKGKLYFYSVFHRHQAPNFVSSFKFDVNGSTLCFDFTLFHLCYDLALEQFTKISEHNNPTPINPIDIPMEIEDIVFINVEVEGKHCTIITFKLINGLDSYYANGYLQPPLLNTDYDAKGNILLLPLEVKQ